MTTRKRILFVALAVAATGLVLFGSSFLAGLAIPWFVSLTAAESRTVRVIGLLATVIAIVVVALTRSRASREADDT